MYTIPPAAYRLVSPAAFPAGRPIVAIIEGSKTVGKPSKRKGAAGELPAKVNDQDAIDVAPDGDLLTDALDMLLCVQDVLNDVQHQEPKHWSDRISRLYFAVRAFNEERGQ